MGNKMCHFDRCLQWGMSHGPPYNNLTITISLTLCTRTARQGTESANSPVSAVVHFAKGTVFPLIEITDRDFRLKQTLLAMDPFPSSPASYFVGVG